MQEVVNPKAAEMLNDYISEKGLKKAYLADKLGMSPSNFGAYIHGLRKFDADFALKISKVLDLDPNYFLSKNYRFYVENKQKEK